MEKLRVVCISNSRLVKSLTIGRIFDVHVYRYNRWLSADHRPLHKYYTFNENLYSSDDFITMDEWRNKQLNQLI